MAPAGLSVAGLVSSVLDESAEPSCASSPVSTLHGSCLVQRAISAGGNPSASAASRNAARGPHVAIVAIMAVRVLPKSV